MLFWFIHQLVTYAAMRQHLRHIHFPPKRLGLRRQFPDARDEFIGYNFGKNISDGHEFDLP